MNYEVKYPIFENEEQRVKVLTKASAEGKIPQYYEDGYLFFVELFERYFNIDEVIENSEKYNIIKSKVEKLKQLKEHYFSISKAAGGVSSLSIRALFSGDGILVNLLEYLEFKYWFEDGELKTNIYNMQIDKVVFHEYTYYAFKPLCKVSDGELFRLGYLKEIVIKDGIEVTSKEEIEQVKTLLTHTEAILSEKLVNISVFDEQDKLQFYKDKLINKGYLRTFEINNLIKEINALSQEQMMEIILYCMNSEDYTDNKIGYKLLEKINSYDNIKSMISKDFIDLGYFSNKVLNMKQNYKEVVELILQKDIPFNMTKQINYKIVLKDKQFFIDICKKYLKINKNIKELLVMLLLVDSEELLSVEHYQYLADNLDYFYIDSVYLLNVGIQDIHKSKLKVRLIARKHLQKYPYFDDPDNIIKQLNI